MAIRHSVAGVLLAVVVLLRPEQGVLLVVHQVVVVPAGRMALEHW